MAAIANATTEESFEIRVAALRAHDLYTCPGSLLKPYVERTWLDPEIVPMWAQCYRQVYHGGINTNNHMESMNRVFKAKFLKLRNDQRMESLVEEYVLTIVPYYLRTYLLQNLKSIRAASMLRVQAWPPWANGRPETVVKQLMERAERGGQLR